MKANNRGTKPKQHSQGNEANTNNTSEKGGSSDKKSNLEKLIPIIAAVCGGLIATLSVLGNSLLSQNLAMTRERKALYREKLEETYTITLTLYDIFNDNVGKAATFGADIEMESSGDEKKCMNTLNMLINLYFSEIIDEYLMLDVAKSEFDSALFDYYHIAVILNDKPPIEAFDRLKEPFENAQQCCISLMEKIIQIKDEYI